MTPRARLCFVAALFCFVAATVVAAGLGDVKFSAILIPLGLAFVAGGLLLR